MSGDRQCPIDCGYCYYQCPRVEEPELRAGLEEFYEVVSKDGAIRGVCHNGGALISLLASALEDARVEGCITVAATDGATPEVRVAMNKAALMENSGGSYGYSAVLTGIADAILNYGLWSVALVGTPCQMAGCEKMLAVGRGTHNAHDFSSNVRLRIGLLCQGAYSYDTLLKDFIEGERGIPADTITNFEIQDDGLHVYGCDEELLHAGLDEIAAYKREGCKICDDFIGRFADISVGHIGSPPGKSTVIVHTEVGKDAFESARQWDFIEAGAMDERGVKLLRLLQEDKKKAGKAEKERRKHTVEE
jgi:coenzyme F420 hydrogenase subunit beta